MTKKTLLSLVLCAAAVFAGVWYFARETPSDGPERPVTAASTAAMPPVSSTAPGAASAVAIPVADDTSAPAPELVQKWLADANGGDARLRSEAIAGLARAPRHQALPALQWVLTNGEPSVDRPAALRSLRELALAQGDADGKIREGIRETLYHGDDQNPTLMADAQATLDVVEESERR